MKAMVLAAGLGLRLRPLTVSTAKPALPILGRPLLAYTLSVLERSEVRDVVINLHHQPENLRRILSTLKGNHLQVHTSHEPEILGTGGGLKKVEEILQDDTFFLINGDTLVDVDLDELAGWHRENKAEATLLLRPKPTGSNYTGIRLGPTGRIEAIEKGDGASLMFAGVWVLEPSVFERLPAGRPASLEVDLLPELVRDKSAFGFVRDGAWFDIGTPKRYLRACLSVVRHGYFRPLWKAERVEPTRESSEGVIVVAGPETTIHPSAQFCGDAVLGAGCHVGHGAFIQRSVFWDGVVIGEGVVVRNSVVADGVSLASGSLIQNKVVMRTEEASLAELRARELVDGHVVAEIKH
jgi:mannose-1-phosphate guanylyltransferase